MLGAIYIGLSGLDAYARGLQQVSNNVTNLNTSGFKSSTVRFNSYYGNEGQGGLSFSGGGQDSGSGVGVGQQTLDMKAGELRQTDRDLDLAINGNGFLVLLDGQQTRYVRTGSFEVDKDGFITLSGTNYRLATLDANNSPVSLSIDKMRTNAPKGTTTIKFADNLSSTITKPFSISNLTVYDSAGGAHLWTVSFTKQATGTGFDVTVTDNKGVTTTAQTLKFLTSGAIDPTTTTLSVTDSTGASATLDFSGTTSYSGGDSSTLRSASIDGWGVGSLTGVKVNDTGQVELSYSNNQKAQLGTIALADFRDVQGLAQESGGLFRYDGSGERDVIASNDPRVGKVLGQRLEASNVDLSQEFGDLILIQRGYQASSQIISVSNDMIQQLFGIRGQAG